ncbi:MAG: acyl-CoA dehydrogenase family protein, partial [Thermomicrobiales bacterium]|nr:acyl-CoA dehydrogenase family protein [Thermomicrobiales bacterium]
MDFSLTPEQVQLRDTVREFAAREVAPYIREWDANGEFHPEILYKMGELGLLGLPIPEEYGGAGMDYVALALACEELEYVDTFLRVAMSVHVGLNSLALLQWGTEDQKQRFLTPQAQGEKLGTFGLTEPNAGSDAGSIESTYVQDGDSYVLNGSKMWISLADVADHFLVFASYDRSLKHNGLTAFIVERGMEGFTTGTIKGKLGVRAGNTGELAFNNVRVPLANRVGEEGEGFKIAMSCIDQGRFTVGAGAVGLIRACLDASVKYANERYAFGGEIGRFELVKQMIAKMVANEAASRLLTMQAAELKNRGIRNTRETSLMKWYGC